MALFGKGNVRGGERQNLMGMPLMVFLILRCHADVIPVTSTDDVIFA